MIINEASLLKFLNIDEIVNCVAVYEHGNDISIILEYMDNGSMTKIIQENH